MEGEGAAPLLVYGGSYGNERLGAILKHLRIRNALNTKDVAAAIGFHVSFVRGIERGAQAPSLETFRKIMAVLDRKDGGVVWGETDDTHDVILSDPVENITLPFVFKSETKGQHKRPEPKVKMDNIDKDVIMHDEDIRLHCIIQAKDGNTLSVEKQTAEDIVERAEKFYNFIKTGETK